MEDTAQTLWIDDFLEGESNTSNMGKWILGLLVFCLLIMTALHFQIVSRGLLNVPNGSLASLVERLNEPGFNLQESILHI